MNQSSTYVEMSVLCKKDFLSNRIWPIRYVNRGVPRGWWRMELGRSDVSNSGSEIWFRLLFGALDEHRQWEDKSREFWREDKDDWRDREGGAATGATIRVGDTRGWFARSSVKKGRAGKKVGGKGILEVLEG